VLKQAQPFGITVLNTGMKTLEINDITLSFSCLKLLDGKKHSIERCFFLPLETTDSCLIGWVEQIRFADSLIFVHNGKEIIMMGSCSFQG
jgi:hypothetical protein